MKSSLVSKIANGLCNSGSNQIVSGMMKIHRVFFDSNRVLFDKKIAAYKSELIAQNAASKDEIEEAEFLYQSRLAKLSAKPAIEQAKPAVKSDGILGLKK